ncbi:MAG: hypothetical protein EOM20_17445 [Spartobacteria bacterium]|nr:hypothetical protein [Spartobacteria bacterium]
MDAHTTITWQDQSLIAKAKFPIIGKNEKKVSNHWKNCHKNFQSLEKSSKKFPIIGKITKKVSNHWKNSAYSVCAANKQLEALNCSI